MTGINFTRQAGDGRTQARRLCVRAASRRARPSPISERHIQKAGRHSCPPPTQKGCINTPAEINLYYLKTATLNY
jgi:hypothetical protein